ncbi:hypothetical protein JG687_00007444 [Phytophthora cactorum]|uniref:Uncharacterized protein n=1 Tax=Phytophthora cactorum TaxID=29920 RepID=A0A8T1UKA4_9STRA|nr:hypothetical protein JG687_00007444 [Phytophthora cactorum]
MVHRAPQEKVFIVHTHKYFLADAQTLLDPLGRAVRECVAKCLAVSANMVARVVAAYNVHGEEAFAIISDRTMREELARMDVFNIKGRKRDPRNAYLEKKLAILSARLVPKLTEMYLDESYGNVNHVAGGGVRRTAAPTEDSARAYYGRAAGSRRRATAVTSWARWTPRSVRGVRYCLIRIQC